ncbi:uncharacterized protein L3040_006946 [Drepanopeziza brunnea f. sp. 'multigermtubi']|uniref:uncharacterized protein n=1 Tax=Drepanopeziza brunnea f. sp. 'multigermtubi' TaxID=698441 RepID=UPI00238E7F78|nr:hypothetical protein L3040_006946 [Drepanopeziza brunnea f. sp. 'multigermtubi']
MHEVESFADNEREPFVPNPSPVEYDQRIPRIQITPSLLYANALMRGKASIQNDILISNLYNSPSRAAYNRRIRLEVGSSPKNSELPRGTTFFWDSLNPAPVQEQPRPRTAKYAPTEKQTTYAEHIRETKLPVMKHYSGEQVNENWGLLKIGDKWADPDSEYDLYRAIQLHEHGIDLYKPASRPLNFEPEPEYEPPRMDNGPRIMTPEEEDEFYKGYVEEVTDEVDAEGDPRQYRISPATFAQWAAGAGRGDRYVVETPIVPNLPSPGPQDDDQMNAKPKSEAQFDMETGDALSDICDPSSVSSVLYSPQSLDVVRPPVSYSYSYPKEKVEVDRAANAEQYEKNAKRASALVSTPEVFNSEGGIIAHTDDNDLEAGAAAYDTAKDYMFGLRVSSMQNYGLASNTHGVAKQTSEARISLAQQVFFMKEKLRTQGHSPPLFPAPPATSNTTSNTIPYFSCADTPQTGSPATATVAAATSPEPASPLPQAQFQLPRPRSQYRRYFEEETERLQLAARKMVLLQQQLEQENQAMLAQIEELKVERDQLLKALGFDSVDQIQDLIPKRETNGRELKDLFGLKGDL